MKTIQSKTIVFITGAFVSNKSWGEWPAYFEARGYKTIIPSWPHKDAPAASLRAMPAKNAIATNRLETVLDHYESIIKALPEKPILIGHSFGGLMTQILVNRGLAAAGIAIHSVPPQGVFTFEPSFYKSTWGALGFLTSSKESYMMPFEHWQYTFTNTMPLQLQKESYEAYAIPESKLMSRDALTSAAKVDFKKPHAPLLFIAGSIDHIMPASLNRSNYKRYKDAGSVTEYKEFENRNHFVLGQEGWQEVAGYIGNWIKTN